MTGDEPMSINREDMMELTRRMTLSRNCFSRLAGAYMDEEGFIDGTFHTHFLKLSKAEQEKNLKLAKAIPFAKTNEQLKSHSIGSSSEFRKLLLALRECELKNDALLYNLSENAINQAIPTASMYFTEPTTFPEKALTTPASGNPKKSTSS